MKKFRLIVCILLLIALFATGCALQSEEDPPSDGALITPEGDDLPAAGDGDKTSEAEQGFVFLSTVDLSDKTYYAYGDSITWGYFQSARMEKPYPTQVAELLRFQSYLNLGENGATLCANEMGLPNMTERILSRPYYADVVSVLMGVNDYNRSLPLGTPSDTDNTTIYGSLYLIMEHFKTYYADSFVFFMTPFDLYLNGHDGYKNNSQGYNLGDVSTAIKTMAARYGYPVLDLLADGRFECEMRSAISDGIHPSQDFFEKHTAPQVAQFINDHFDSDR